MALGNEGKDQRSIVFPWTFLYGLWSKMVPELQLFTLRLNEDTEPLDRQRKEE